MQTSENTNLIRSLYTLTTTTPHHTKHATNNNPAPIELPLITMQLVDLIDGQINCVHPHTYKTRRETERQR
jgi:hypothetical protein